MKVRTINKIRIAHDIKNPKEFPWKFLKGLFGGGTVRDKSVKQIECAGVFEFIPAKLRGKFMDEVYRILRDDGAATFTLPYWNTWRAILDYETEWPPICEQSFLLFNKEWRDANGKKKELKCDFDFTYGYGWEPVTAARNEETRAFNTKYYSNVVDALQVVLTKREKKK